MAWFNRVDVSDSTEKPSISPDTEPTMYEKLRAQSWFLWAVRALAAIVLIVVIVLLARTIHHHIKNDQNKPTATVTGTRPGDKQTSNSNKSTSGSQSGSSPSNGSSSTKSPSPSATTQSPNQVPNTGPGDVAAVFAASVFAAASLHYIVQLRRQS